MSENETDIFVAKTGAFVLLPSGEQIRMRRGQTVRVGHPLLRGREHLFKPFEVTYDVPIEARAGTKRRRRS